MNCHYWQRRSMNCEASLTKRKTVQSTGPLLFQQLTSEMLVLVFFVSSSDLYRHEAHM